MTIKIQVNNKMFSIRVKQLDNLQVGVSVWRKKSLRFGTTFGITTSKKELKDWVRSFINSHKDKFCTR